jgi:hypothetical protein
MIPTIRFLKDGEFSISRVSGQDSNDPDPQTVSKVTVLLDCVPENVWTTHAGIDFDVLSLAEDGDKEARKEIEELRNKFLALHEKVVLRLPLDIDSNGKFRRTVFIKKGKVSL